MGYLSKEQKQFYKENGYILLNNVFSERELDQCTKAYDDLFQLKKQQNSNLEATWAGNWNKSLEAKEKTNGKSVKIDSIVNSQIFLSVI